MKKSIKFLACFCLIIAVICSMFSFVSAKTFATVYSETLTAKSGENIEIPVYIKNNTGLMGYKFIISYDKSVFTPVKVTQGSALKGGLFNDSVDATKTNEFVVLWSNTADVTADGLLFTISFKTSSEATGKQTINIEYSRDDTFNESWQTVQLNCENATVDFGGTEPEPVPTSNLWEKIVNILKKFVDFIINMFK